MRKEEFYIPSTDGKTKLHGFTWTPDGEVKAVMQLVHGMVEYIDRYDAFAGYLADNGIAVVGHDHLGHGKSVSSEEKLGYFAEKNGDEIVVDDMHAVTEYAKSKFPGVPNYILGHSMGSFLTRRYLTKYPEAVSGAVIMGTGWIPGVLATTGLTAAKAVSKLKGACYRSKLLTNLALGSNNKPFAPNRTDVDWLSRNEENVDRYVADPLCGFVFTSAAYVDFFNVMKKLAKKEGFDRMNREMPVLIISGEVDPVGGKSACDKLYAQYQDLGMKKVTEQIYPGDRHEILNEIDRDTVYRDILNWVKGTL